MSKTVSVLLPNYNHAHYIGEAIEAFLSQSFKPLEIVVIDDASTDDSLKVIEAFRKKNPIIRVVRNEKNMGPVACNNRELPTLSGDYVHLAAADDKVLPGLFEQSLRLLSRYPKAGFCSSLGRLMDQNGKDLGPYNTPIISDEECYLSPERINSIHKKFGEWVVPNTVVFRRGAILEFGGFDLELGPSADGFLHCALALKHGACFIPRPLGLWRETLTGYAASHAPDFRASMDLLERLEDRMRGKHRDVFPPEYADLFKRRALRAMVYGLSRRNPYRHDHILEAGRAMPVPGVLDRAYFAGMRLYLEVGRWATKIYVFLQHPLREQARIILGKLRS